jgi:hypothetical protein
LDAPWDLGEDCALSREKRFLVFASLGLCSPSAGIAAAGAAKPNQQLIERHVDERRVVFRAR